MDFRTEYQAKPAGICLDPEKPIALLGSCFSINIGSRMRSALWDARINACGTLFNPATLAGAIDLALGTKELAEPWCDGDIWRSWDFPAEAAALTREDCLRKCRNATEKLAGDIKDADALIVTFGTAVVYELAEENGRIVANCHKRPARIFRRRMLDADTVFQIWKNRAEALRRINPSLKLIFTVSPVRHVKEGFEDNCISKATLRLACARLAAEIPDADYFAAFEILTDDLRDYRFYASDLVHPSEEASGYIFEKFRQTYLSDSARRLLFEAESISRRLRHRPLVAGSADAVAFEEKSRELAESFASAHPAMLHPAEICR